MRIVLGAAVAIKLFLVLDVLIHDVSGLPFYEAKCRAGWPTWVYALHWLKHQCDASWRKHQIDGNVKMIDSVF